jgi:LuxR family transcriptional regulator, maltose regulon positive regulatory protein
LDRLLRAADEGQRAGSALEISVLQAVADQMRDNVSAAISPLERALTLAEPEGYVRIFVDQGPPMAALLEAAAERGIAASYVRRLLGAFDKGEPCTPVRQDFGRPIERT